MLKLFILKNHHAKRNLFFLLLSLATFFRCFFLPVSAQQGDGILQSSGVSPLNKEKIADLPKKKQPKDSPVKKQPKELPRQERVKAKVPPKAIVVSEDRKEVVQKTKKFATTNHGMRILILGDSMSLSGLGLRLDSRLRKTPGVVSVNTYMACGSNPLSWLKRKPYTNIKTRCGYWSIQDGYKGGRLRVVKDTYGMKRGHKPSARRVPKLEDLILKHRPNILIFQNGNNLFGCFKDKRTVKKKTHANAISWYVNPFLKEVSKPGTPLKKFYWVTPPEAGCVSKDVQAFIYEQIDKLASPVTNVIDSRKVTSYPYRRMGPDKEHFWGKEANEWADSVYDTIVVDLHSRPLKEISTLDKRTKTPPVKKPKIESAGPNTLRVLASLSKITKVPPTKTFAPYQELLVAYRYKIVKVFNGKLEDKAIIVMHPAYIQLKLQDLSSYKIGETYEFELNMMDETSLWGAIRTSDDTDSLELTPYLLACDEARHPDAKEVNGEQNAQEKR